MSGVKLSVVLVNYNTRAITLACLESLERHCPEAEVILVDNASKDGSVAAIRGRFPEVKLIALERNEGFAGGNNAGLALARMRDLTGGFRAPADGCESYRALMDGLAAVEADLHRHIHKENNVLFPRAAALEARLAAASA